MDYNVVTISDVYTNFWVAFLFSAVLAFPIWRLLIRWKSRQTISQYAPEGHQVKQGTPTMGGLIIAVGACSAYLFGAIAIGSMHSDSALPAPLPNLSLISLILFAGFALIGFVDDFLVPRLFAGKRGLGWKQKILMQLVLASVAAMMNYQWKWHPTVAATVFLILFFSNAYNFADGLDGLAGTILLGLAGGFAALGWLSGNAYVTLVMAPLLAAAIPFLYLNSPPAKVFMGDVGSLPIGAVLGLASSVLMFSPPGQNMGTFLGTSGFAASDGLAVGLNGLMFGAVAIASLMMMAELIPVPMQIFSVKLLKRKIFPYTPIHHAFEKAGWRETRVVGMFALTQLLLSVLAISVFLQFTVANFSMGSTTDSPPEQPVGR